MNVYALCVVECSYDEQIYIYQNFSVLQKIEIIDDEESDMMSNSEVEQVNSFLDYKVKVISNCELIKRRY